MPELPRKLEIKKYPNRRYYDATHSRHLTLDEIRSLIQNGHDIRVTDAKTGADITAQLLTQIILELETAKLDSFPVPLLLRVIRMNDRLVKEFIDKYFSQALASFLQYQQQMEEQFRSAHVLPAAFSSVSAWTKAMLGPFAAAVETPAPRTPKPNAAPENQNEDLREMIRELQQQVTELKKPRARKSKARRSRR